MIILVKKNENKILLLACAQNCQRITAFYLFMQLFCYLQKRWYIDEQVNQLFDNQFEQQHLV